MYDLRFFSVALLFRVFEFGYSDKAVEANGDELEPGLVVGHGDHLCYVHLVKGTELGHTDRAEKRIFILLKLEDDEIISTTHIVVVYVIST